MLWVVGGLGPDSRLAFGRQVLQTHRTHRTQGIIFADGRGPFSDSCPSDHTCTPPTKRKSESNDSMFAEAEIQEVWIHCLFI